MATQAELPVYLPILPSEEKLVEKAEDEHQCLATLWRRARHRFTPKTVKEIPTSDRFQNRLHMWTLIRFLGSNTKSWFETTRFLRSNEGGLTTCYALRRLAQNIQEPFRTLSLKALDTTIRWWKGKPAP